MKWHPRTGGFGILCISYPPAGRCTGSGCPDHLWPLGRDRLNGGEWLSEKGERTSKRPASDRWACYKSESGYRASHLAPWLAIVEVLEDVGRLSLAIATRSGSLVDV